MLKCPNCKSKHVVAEEVQIICRASVYMPTGEVVKLDLNESYIPIHDCFNLVCGDCHYEWDGSIEVRNSSITLEILKGWRGK